ncbi:MAG: hypothetical protein RLZZ345_126 [Actinomycetota bacterium]|jgi:uncharacterized membrane protein (UPF0182 family)
MATRKDRQVSPVTVSIVILSAIFFSLVGAAGVYTDWLWFEQLGFSGVFTTQIVAQVVLFAAAAVIAGVFTWLAVWLAIKTRPVYVRQIEGDPLAVYRALAEQLRKVVQIVLPIIVALFAGLAASSQWQLVAVWANSTKTGDTDAQFGLDVSFYLFELPFYTFIVGFFATLLLFVLALTIAGHLVFGNIRFNGRSASVAKPARIQIAITAAVFLAVQGASQWLDQYATLTSDAGLFTGATYSDVNAAIPSFQILALIAFVVAVLFMVTAVISRWRIALVGTGLMVVSSIVLAGVFPWVVQSFQVVPNERTLEAPYIQRNLDATKKAYGLDKIEMVEYKAKTDTDATALRADVETTANIRLIDPGLVSSAFRQLQQVQQYYSFANHLDVGRYQIDGKTQDTVIAVRELNQSGLGSSQSWYNNTIVYTHGYGVVAAYGNKSEVDGQPVFLQSGIPNEGLLGKFEPRIYFGENSPLYSIVGPTADGPRELDFPDSTGASASAYTFTGNGGPKLDNFVKRIAYALKFQSEQIMLSDAIGDKSQILYNRDPLQRVQAVAPYLTLDSDPYPAVVNGRVLWIVDGYTTSANYPYSSAENYSQSIADSASERTLTRGKINYIRNSVKATVDAYDGSVKLYAWDETDPILKTWSKIYPNSLLPVSQMSGELISHVRYPSDLFKIQRAVLGSYHVKDAGVFYSQSDGWMTPNDPTGAVSPANGSTLQPPYYLSMKLPGETETKFSLYSTFIPRATSAQSRNVLRGYLVADSEAGSEAGKIGSNYGKLTLLSIPKDLNIPGPGLVQNNFSADSEVSKLLNILRQGSTTVLNGNLLTLPVGGGLLYVQPVYIQSTGETSYPLLKKVLVAFGDKIAFEDTLSGALDVLFGGDTGTPLPDEGEQPGEPITVNAQIKAQLAIAERAIADKAAAMAANDWTAYGKADARLNAAIEQLLKLLN